MSKALAGRVDGTTSTLASFAYALPYYCIGLTIWVTLGLPLGDLSAPFWIFVLLRSTTDAAAEWLKMSALEKAEVSLVGPFFALSPVILLFIGPLVSGDDLSLLGVVGVILTVIGSIGLLPIRRPDASFETSKRQESVQGIIMAIGASVFFAFNTLFDRLAVQRAPSIISAAAMTAAATIPFIIPVIYSESRRKAFAKEKYLFHLRGILEVVFMTLKLSALEGLSGAYVAGLMRLSVLTTIIGGRIFFNEQQTRRRLGWGSLICLGSIFIIIG